MLIEDKNGFGRIDVRTIPMPDFARDVSATYLFTGQVFIFYRKDGDPAGKDFKRIGLLNDDGTGFREIFCGDIPQKKTANGIRHMPMCDNKRVLLGDYVLEATPDLYECEHVEIVPVEYPWGLENNPMTWAHWSEIIMAPDSEHMSWTALLKNMTCVVGIGKLVRYPDKYVIENVQVISSDESFKPDPEHEGCIIPLPFKGGEVKQFVKGGTAVSQVGGASLYEALPNSVVQDLTGDGMTGITHCPGYEETTIFSPDEKLGLVMSTRNSPATNCAVLGLMPRPYAPHTMSMMYNYIYMYAIAGSRFFRKGNIGPVLIDIEKSTNDPNYFGVPLNDPEELWVYHSPMSWHPDGKKVMWQEQMRGGSQPRIRIAELLDYVPGETVPAQPTPDDIPYAKPEPALGAIHRPMAGKVMGKHSGFMTFEPVWQMKNGAMVGKNTTTYCNYTDDGKDFYNGTESVEMCEDHSVIYTGNVTLEGEHKGRMDLRIAFTAGGYSNPPRLNKALDEDGLPVSRGYAEYNGKRLNVEDMRE